MKYIKDICFQLITIILLVAIISCSKNNPTELSPTQNGDSPPSDIISLPFTENFDSDATDIFKNWYFYHPGLSSSPAAGSVCFQLDNSTYSSSPACMSGGQDDGMQYVGFSGWVYYGGALTLRKNIDLSTKSSCTLTFFNKRDVVTSKSLPSTGEFSGDISDSKCHIMVSPNGGQTWSSFKAFSTDRSNWYMETVSLNIIVGRSEARIQFLMPLHASGNNHSTKWYIDDITIVAN
jgi:hypothetical protein